MLDRLSRSSLLDVDTTNWSRTSQLVSGPYYQSFRYKQLVDNNALALVGNIVAQSRSIKSATVGGACSGQGSCQDYVSKCHIRCPLLPNLGDSILLLFLGKGSIQLNHLRDWIDPGAIWLSAGSLGGASPTILVFQSWKREKHLCDAPKDYN